MAVRVHFVGGGSVMLEESLESFERNFDSRRLVSAHYDTVRYPSEGVLIMLNQVTHAEDLDNAENDGPDTSDWPA